MTEQDFRTILLAVFASGMGIALVYRLRSKTKERLDRWQEGKWILFGLRLGGLPFVVGSIAWMIDPNWMAWSSYPSPDWLRWIGIGSLVVWAGLLLWTFHNLGRNLTDTVVIREGHTLVITGPYRFVRHPFYVAFALAVIAFGLVMANWFVLVTGCIPLGFIVARTRIEEENLVQRFGDDYRDYMAKTGRFFPRLGK